MELAPDRIAANNGAAYGVSFGLVTPMGNPCAEPEIAILTGATVLAARAGSAADDSRARLEDYIDALGPALDSFDRTPLAAAGFACTCYYLRGSAAERRDLAALETRRGHPVITSTTAIRAMAKALGVSRLGLVAPYPGWLAEAAKAYFAEAGLTIAAHAGLPRELVDTRGIYRLTPADVAEAASRLDTGSIDAVLIGGTGMPSLHVVAGGNAIGGERIGRDFAIPVFSSNIALAAALMDAAGAPDAYRRILAAGAAWRGRLALWGQF